MPQHWRFCPKFESIQRFWTALATAVFTKAALQASGGFVHQRRKALDIKKALTRERFFAATNSSKEWSTLLG